MIQIRKGRFASREEDSKSERANVSGIGCSNDSLTGAHVGMDDLKEGFGPRTLYHEDYKAKSDTLRWQVHEDREMYDVWCNGILGDGSCGSTGTAGAEEQRVDLVDKKRLLVMNQYGCVTRIMSCVFGSRLWQSENR